MQICPGVNDCGSGSRSISRGPKAPASRTKLLTSPVAVGLTLGARSEKKTRHPEGHNGQTIASWRLRTASHIPGRVLSTTRSSQSQYHTNAAATQTKTASPGRRPKCRAKSSKHCFSQASAFQIDREDRRPPTQDTSQTRQRRKQASDGSDGASAKSGKVDGFTDQETTADVEIQDRDAKTCPGHEQHAICGQGKQSSDDISGSAGSGLLLHGDIRPEGSGKAHASGGCAYQRTSPGEETKTGGISAAASRLFPHDRRRRIKART